LVSKNVHKHKPIEICFYQEHHQDFLKSFYLPESQKPFTAMPLEVLEDALSDQMQYPIVIDAENRPVGFFILHYQQEFQALVGNPKALLLRAFSVNHQDQGNGFAKRALEQLPQFVRTHFPQVDEVVLAVNEKNEHAKRVYLNSGFLDKGITRVGRIGLQHILHCPI
jgi:RimJ/RimL family protein N-acetyltransferase